MCVPSAAQITDRTVLLTHVPLLWQACLPLCHSAVQSVQECRLLSWAVHTESGDGLRRLHFLRWAAHELAHALLELHHMRLMSHLCGVS